ncbi:MAG: lipoyl(octanoyl) transferase LipB [Opitutaceae bacterium]|nr:lipoyl(octanoyl) transferase LipB [Opitutaceae bacterium]
MPGCQCFHLLLHCPHVHHLSKQVTVEDWGRTQYDEALARQLTLLDQRLAGTRGDVLVFTEHEPVFTLGLRAGADAHLLWDESQLKAAGIAVRQTNRGGDITYHGPGQLVAYPIVSLERSKDLHAYLRFLEEVLIDTVASFGLTATRREGKTGIWIEHRKIAAIGVAARRWVAYHGIALNVSPNLSHFTGIIPCGITATDGSVTSLAHEGVSHATLESAKAAFATAFMRRWVE